MPNPRFFGRFHSFANSGLWLQLSIWVLIVSQYDIYVKHTILHALSPPIVQFVIQSLFIKSFRKTPNFLHYFTATQWIVIRSQFGEWKVKEHLKLHLLHIYHIVIRSQLKYLIGAKDLSSRKWGSVVWYNWPKNCGFISGPGTNHAKTE